MSERRESPASVVIILLVPVSLSMLGWRNAETPPDFAEIAVRAKPSTVIAFANVRLCRGKPHKGEEGCGFTVLQRHGTVVVGEDRLPFGIAADQKGRKTHRNIVPVVARLGSRQLARPGSGDWVQGQWRPARADGAIMGGIFIGAMKIQGDAEM